MLINLYDAAKLLDISPSGVQYVVKKHSIKIAARQAVVSNPVYAHPNKLINSANLYQLADIQAIKNKREAINGK